MCVLYELMSVALIGFTLHGINQRIIFLRHIIGYVDMVKRPPLKIIQQCVKIVTTPIYRSF